jgi:hypothetical protein
MPIITEMFAFCTEEKEGDEGVIGFLSPQGQWIPLVGADMDRVKSLLNIAKEIATEQNLTVVLKRFALIDTSTIHTKKETS